MQHSAIRKVIIRIIIAVFAAGIAVAAVASAQILSTYVSSREIPDNALVIILGCGLSPADHITPSTMLTLRLEAAESYIAAHPDAPVILSGGQGADELISEAEAMRRWFDTRGYDMARFYTEDTSENTETNLRYSGIISADNKLTEDGGAVIVTDGFHQFRAHYFAKRSGFIPYSVSAYAPAHLQAYYWLREIAAIIVQVWL